MEDAASYVLHLCTYVDLSIMTAVVMVAESRTTATKTTVAMMTLELELDVATSSEKKEIIINIYFKTLNGEYTPFAYKKSKEKLQLSARSSDYLVQLALLWDKTTHPEQRRLDLKSFAD